MNLAEDFMHYNTRRLVATITFSGFLVAMSIILQRLFVIPFGVPSLYRISLGTLPIIMASLFLGPLFGGLVGAISDLVGIMLFPVGTFVIWPTLTAMSYGVLPWVFLRLINLLKKKVKFPLIYPFFAFVFITLFVYVLTQDGVRNPISSTRPPLEFTPIFKGVFAVVLAILIGLIIWLSFYLERKMKGRRVSPLIGRPTDLALAILLTAFITDVLYTSWWKLYVYHVNYMVSVFFHMAIMFILFPLQTSFISVLTPVYEKSNLNRLISPNITETPLNSENDDNHGISN